jgi:histidinol-phosphate phosphatase family protein
MTGRRFVLLDRDGTLIRERHYLTDPDQVELIAGAGEALERLRTLGLGIIVVTNQSAVGRGMLDGVRLEQIHDRLRALLAAQDVALDAIYVCPHTPDDHCECRKPRPGLVERARRELELDPRRSFVVGDQASDIALGASVGATTLLVCTGYGAETILAKRARPDHTVRDVAEAAQRIESLLATETPEGRDDVQG